MKYNRTILHPTEEDFNKSGYINYYNFYYEKCKVGELYENWISILKDNNIIFDDKPDILKFSTYKYGYTPYTYKFCFNSIDLISDIGIITNNILSESDYEIFSNLFLINGWEEELIYTFTARETKNINPNYSSNYGEICCHTKSWVDYITFQGSRIILQFRFDDYIKTELRKEKLKKIKML